MGSSGHTRSSQKRIRKDESETEDGSLRRKKKTEYPCKKLVAILEINCIGFTLNLMGLIFSLIGTLVFGITIYHYKVLEVAGQPNIGKTVDFKKLEDLSAWANKLELASIEDKRKSEALTRRAYIGIGFLIAGLIFQILGLIISCLMSQPIVVIYTFWLPI